MTIMEVMDNLAEFLQQTVKDYSTNQKNGCLPISVYAGFPPIRTKGEEKESFVYALVVEADDKADNTLSQATVEIGFSIYDDTKDGWRSLYNLMEHIRQALLKKRTIAGRNRLELPVKYEVADNQPFPQWQGRIVAKYTIGQPIEEEINYEDYQEV